jgi:hypothetical protein
MKPAAVQNRVRPRKIVGLVRAVKGQLLNARDDVAVPWFGELDDVVYLAVGPDTTGPSVFIAVHRGDGWWAFRPGREIGPPGAESHVLSRIRHSTMMRILPSGGEYWTDVH